MPTFIRVRDKSTGYEYDTPASAVDETAHELVNDPEQWPDLDGPRVRPRPPVTGAEDDSTGTTRKSRKTKAGQPATTEKES